MNFRATLNSFFPDILVISVKLYATTIPLLFIKTEDWRHFLLGKIPDEQKKMEFFNFIFFNHVSCFTSYIITGEQNTRQ